jgi:hypothetical protein
MNDPECAVRVCKDKLAAAAWVGADLKGEEMGAASTVLNGSSHYGLDFLAWQGVFWQAVLGGYYQCLENEDEKGVMMEGLD